MGNTNKVFSDSLYGVSFPNCYINLSVKLALAKVKAGKQESRVGAGDGERGRLNIRLFLNNSSKIQRKLDVNAIL